MRPGVLLGSFFLIISLSVEVAGQGRPTTGNSGSRPSRTTGGTNTSTPAIRSAPDLSAIPPVLFLSGKVTVEDGSELTDVVTIESLCAGERYFETYTDRKGNFSFEFGKQRNLISTDAGTTASSHQRPRSVSQQRRELQQCELVAVLPGFTSAMVPLPVLEPSQHVNVGTIALHRIARVEGFTVSATTAMAPAKAKKAYDKALAAEQQKNWQAAEKKLQEAVRIYPRFAVAWLELGRVQLQGKNTAAARESLHQAVAADPQFVSPHQILAALAFQDRAWREVVEETEVVLRLNPLAFPQHWYYNAAAHYSLAEYEIAEKSARQGVGRDVEHHIPKLQYLLGLILARQHKYGAAAEHMRNYVRLAPHATDVAQVNEQIAVLEKLSATAPAVQK